MAVVSAWLEGKYIYGRERDSDLEIFGLQKEGAGTFGPGEGWHLSFWLVKGEGGTGQVG